jgi:hypothetical protein
MDRSDIKAHSPNNRHAFDQVTLNGTGREIELIVAGLQVLAGQIAIRDAISLEPGFAINSSYPLAGRSQGEGVALTGEVFELLAAIENPQYVEHEDLVQPDVALETS